ELEGAARFAKYRGRGERQAPERLIGEKPLDLARILRLEQPILEHIRRLIEITIEKVIDDLDTELMKARDEKQHHRADHQPCPAWQRELPLDAVDLVMQDGRRYAECQAENGDAAQGDRHIDHALAPHRLEDEQAQHAIDEEEQPENVLGRREIAEGCLENGR